MSAAGARISRVVSITAKETRTALIEVRRGDGNVEYEKPQPIPQAILPLFRPSSLSLTRMARVSLPKVLSI